MNETINFKKYDQVVTADDVLLGALLRIHHRQEEINPLLELYASYMEIWSIAYSSHFYVPTDFIDEYDEKADIVYLIATLDEVFEETWDRIPNFIAGRKSKREELPGQKTLL